MVPPMLSLMLAPMQDLMLLFLEGNKQLNAVVLKKTMVAVVYPVLLVNTLAVVHQVIMGAVVQLVNMVALEQLV